MTRQNTDNHRLAARRWKENNAERNALYQKNYQVKYRQNNAEKLRLNKKRDAMLRKYGISLEKYEELYNQQEGKCSLCGSPNTNKWHHGELCVDHDHKTNKFRGLLCDNCNVGLGRFKDDPDLLRKAAQYLEDHKCNTH